MFSSLNLYLIYINNLEIGNSARYLYLLVAGKARNGKLKVKTERDYSLYQFYSQILNEY